MFHISTFSLLLGIIISPYIQIILKALVLFGVFVLFYLIFGTLHYSRVSSQNQSRLPAKRAVFKRKLEPNQEKKQILNPLENAIYSRLQFHLSDRILSPFINKFNKLSPSFASSGFDKSFAQIIEPKLANLTAWIAALAHDHRRIEVCKNITEIVLDSTLKHIVAYKKVRKLILKLSKKDSSLTPESISHLDEFNDGNIGHSWDDITVPDSALLSHRSMEELNLQIVAKMSSMSLLHPALVDEESEKRHLRQHYQILQGKFSSMPPITTSPILQVLSREYLVCQVIWPILEQFSKPDYLNRKVLVKAHKVFAVQKAIRRCD